MLTILSTILFNNLYASDFLVDTAREIVDTTAVNLSDFYHNGHFVDLANILPFHNHYLHWDTATIHPYQFDAHNMQDTVMLLLADHGDCAFVAPVAGFVTSNFGPRSRTRYHYGIDLKLETGDTVVSAFDGMVRIAQYSPSYGNVIVIRHYNGLETVYGHLSRIDVAPGNPVKAGELIGLGGNTGRSTGPHLHFEVRYMGAAIDPNQIIQFTDSTGHDLKTETLEVSSATFEYLRRFRAASAMYAKKKSAIRYYTVRRGDTLSKIAARSGTTINRLCQLNRVSRSAQIRPGQRLKVK